MHIILGSRPSRDLLKVLSTVDDDPWLVLSMGSYPTCRHNMKQAFDVSISCEYGYDPFFIVSYCQ